jgi:predicted MFS family arabinose efflux permease
LAINVAVAISALAANYVNVGQGCSIGSVATHSAKASILSMRSVVLLAALGGFISLSYEIFLFRVVSYASGSSPTAFALTLASFLVGIAGGARRAGEVCDSRSPDNAMRKAVNELLLANLIAMPFLPLMAHFPWRGPGVLGLTIVMVYLIARRWGSLLPYLAQFAIPADEQAGMRASLLYFSNIAGSAAGAILTGFVLSNFLTLVQIALALTAVGILCVLMLIAALDAPISQKVKQGGIAVGVLAIAAVIIHQCRIASRESSVWADWRSSFCPRH